jgi:predicted glycoside hydrolase/deacetylase ChbG (UPF0249 family)
MRHLIINADGYGFTSGITKAIEECVDFGTVRSISANVNFPDAERLAALVNRHSNLSVGCHINPIVGCPLLRPERVPSLVNERGEFFYKSFARRFLSGRIRLNELRAEIEAQIEKTRELAGGAFSHLDFHMGLHRLPGLYALFLDVAAGSARRIRTHRNLVGIERPASRLGRLRCRFGSPRRFSALVWNALLRRKAQNRRLGMPEWRVAIAEMGTRPGAITVGNYVAMLRNLPSGFSEFVAHPGYVDDELRRWSTYLDQREQEREVLLDPAFRSALEASDVRLAGYRDIPLRVGPLPAPFVATNENGRTPVNRGNL